LQAKNPDSARNPPIGGPLLLKLRNIDEELDDAMESRHETSAKVNPVYLDEAAQIEAKAAGILAQASELQNRFVDVLKNIKSAAEIQVQVANWAIRIIAVILLALAVVSRFFARGDTLSGKGPYSNRC
jgi:hypothetical protein